MILLVANIKYIIETYVNSDIVYFLKHVVHLLNTNAISTIINAFLAYHVYFLSKKITFKERLIHKSDIQKRVETFLRKISKGIRRKTEIVNVQRYLKDYPEKNNFSRRYGHTYIKAELKALRFDGIEFICSIEPIYKKKDGSLTLNESANSVREPYDVFVVGLVPYEWIEYIDGNGDEFNYHPQFFAKFDGLRHGPYKYFVYYKQNEQFNKGSDPTDWEYERIEV